MDMTKEIDCWTDESFDDSITRAMLALYESKINKRSLNNRSRSITDKTLQAIRRQGVVVPAPDRVLLWSDNLASIEDYDLMNFPMSGCFSFGEDPENGDPDHMSGYCRLEYYHHVNKLPHGVRRVGVGQAFELVSLYAQQHGEIEGLRKFVTLDMRNGKIKPCVEMDRGFGSYQDALRRANTDPEKAVMCFNMSLQVMDDFRHQWRITAVTPDTKVTVGAYPENVKSLLYARSLPLTASGRKRPILHVVSAHRRRMKEGTDIDINAFLRGTREIEMDGMRFKVDAPQRLIAELLAKQA